MLKEKCAMIIRQLFYELLCAVFGAFPNHVTCILVVIF